MATDKKNSSIYCTDEEKAIARAAIAEYRAEQLKRKAELEAVPKGPIAPEMFLKLVKKYTTPSVALAKPVEYSDQLIITTEQLANFYECDRMQIIQNLNNNKTHFVEGKHYFKLEGEDLKNFKRYIENFDLHVSKFAPTLYLWTKRGAARHAKMLDTEKAWDVFEVLEENYFNKKTEPEPVLSEQAELSLAAISTKDFDLTTVSTEDLMEEVKRRRELVKITLFEAQKEAALLREPPNDSDIITDAGNIVKSRRSASLKELLPIIQEYTGKKWSVTRLYDFCLDRKVPWSKMPPIGAGGTRRRQDYRVRIDTVLQLVKQEE